MITKQRLLDRLDPVRLANRLHNDQRGAMSVLGVFTIFFLTLTLGMIFNIGKQVDEKLRMQNAADAATFSGTRVVSRGMNAIAYGNHLLCEVFALTAYMREARLNPNSTQLPDQTDGSLTPLMPLNAEGEPVDVLDVWEEVGAIMESAGGTVGYQKFEELGRAIQAKVPVERQMVRAFEPLAREHSALTLSLFEYILRGEVGFADYPVENDAYPPGPPEGGLITRFQISVMLNTPMMAQNVAQQVAEDHARNSLSLHNGQDITAVLYRPDNTRLDESLPQEQDLYSRTLPVINPTPVSSLSLPDVNVPITFNPRTPALPPNVSPPTPPPAGYRLLTPDEFYFKLSYDTRTALATNYLSSLIYHWMDIYFTQRTTNGTTPGFFGKDRGSLSQLANFWRIFTCGQLNKLLHQEHFRSNLPFVIRGPQPILWHSDPNAVISNPRDPLFADYRGLMRSFYNNTWYVLDNGGPIVDPTDSVSRELRDDYHIVGVVAWNPITLFGHRKIFRNPFAGNRANPVYTMAFAESKFFLPFRMYQHVWVIQGTGRFGEQYESLHTNGWPSGRRDWSMLNQNWRAKMVPVTATLLPRILERPVGGNMGSSGSPPNFNGIDIRDIRRVSSH